MSTILLFAPASIRRSKARLQAYERTHAQLAAEVAAMREACSEEVLAAALEIALADLTRAGIDRMRETW